MKVMRFLPTAALVFATAFIINACGGDGNSSSLGGDSGVTYEGETYPTVVIGTQTWFAKNLNYNANGSRCYGDNPDNCTKYGRLYDWAAANTACPTGWHLPYEAEWQALIEAIGGYSNAGAKLKAKSGWNGGGVGTDSFGFSALPGGTAGANAIFGNDVGDKGNWWTATTYGGYAYYLELVSRNSDVDIRYTGQTVLNSVRCIKD
jgi:uncharacterized protein (TIGR02145 family)